MIFATLVACQLVSAPLKGDHRQVRVEPVCKQVKITDIPAHNLEDCRLKFLPILVEEHFPGKRWAVKATCNEEHDA